MHATIRRALCAVGLTGGIVLLGIGLAEAASAEGNGPTTSGQGGILSGNQTGAAATAPVDASGNQITVIGHDNTATSTGGATTAPAATGSPTTSGQDGGGSGNQTAVGVQAPVNASGNQVTVIGHDNTAHSTSAAATGGEAGSSAPTTSGQDGIGSGNQTAVGVQAPVNASGNQVTVVGDDNSAASSGATSTGSGGSTAAAPTTTGVRGLIAGNQTGLGLTLPINLSGNQVTVVGDDNTVGSTGAAGSSTTDGTSGGSTTSGQDGIASGNQTGLTALAPVAATGNQVTVIGHDNTVGSTGGSSSGAGGSSGGATTSGQDGIASGNQTGLTALAPVAATGNQITVIGQDNTVSSSSGGSTTGGTAGPGATTTGESGVGSGNQTPVAVQVPVDTSGNQVTVIGQDNTVTSTSVSPPAAGGDTPSGTPSGTPSATPSGTPSAPQGAGEPGASALPNTGAPSDLLALLLLGLLLLPGGLLLTGSRRLAAL